MNRELNKEQEYEKQKYHKKEVYPMKGVIFEKLKYHRYMTLDKEQAGPIRWKEEMDRKRKLIGMFKSMEKAAQECPEPPKYYCPNCFLRLPLETFTCDDCGFQMEIPDIYKPREFGTKHENRD